MPVLKFVDHAGGVAFMGMERNVSFGWCHMTHMSMVFLQSAPASVVHLYTLHVEVLQERSPCRAGGLLPGCCWCAGPAGS